MENWTSPYTWIIPRRHTWSENETKPLIESQGQTDKNFEVKRSRGYKCVGQVVKAAFSSVKNLDRGLEWQYGPNVSNHPLVCVCVCVWPALVSTSLVPSPPQKKGNPNPFSAVHRWSVKFETRLSLDPRLYPRSAGSLGTKLTGPVSIGLGTRQNEMHAASTLKATSQQIGMQEIIGPEFLVPRFLIRTKP